MNTVFPAVISSQFLGVRETAEAEATRRKKAATVFMVIGWVFLKPRFVACAPVVFPRGSFSKISFDIAVTTRPSVYKKRCAQPKNKPSTWATILILQLLPPGPSASETTLPMRVGSNLLVYLTVF